MVLSSESSSLKEALKSWKKGRRDKGIVKPPGRHPVTHRFYPFRPYSLLPFTSLRKTPTLTPAWDI